MEEKETKRQPPKNPRGPNRDYVYAYETYDEIARKMGISKQAVQKIEKRALAKLKMECDKRGWNFASMMEDVIEARQLRDRRNARNVSQDALESESIRVPQTF